MHLYFITGNKGKFEEVKAMLPTVEQLSIDLPELQEIDPKKIIEEKLRVAGEQVDGEIMVEDTSLFLACLNGLPGPLIKWFLKTMGTEGLFHLAHALGDTGAQAKTLIGYAKNKNSSSFFEGIIEGTIVAPRGNLGFGWDPIFQPNGSDKTFGEMTREEKSVFSMRRIAVEKLKRLGIPRMTIKCFEHGMTIVPFTNKHLHEMAKLFVEEYSDGPKRQWDEPTAAKYLDRFIKQFPQYCVAALNENGEFIGGIASRIDPYYQGTRIFVDSLVVAKHHQRQGVGTALVQSIVETARQNGLDGIYFQGDSRNPYTSQWFKKLGFIETGWVEYEAGLDEITL